MLTARLAGTTGADTGERHEQSKRGRRDVFFGMGSTGTVGGAVVALAMDRPDLWPSVVLCYVLAGGAMVAGSKIDIDINATNKGFWLFAVHVFIALIWPFAFLSAASRGDIGKKPDA